MKKPKIAVIGSGISGLSSVWMLGKKFKVGNVELKGIEL